MIEAFKPVLPALVSTLAFCATALPAAADQLADIKKKGELVCGTLGTDEPFSFKRDGGKDIVGYDVDFCSAVAKSLGVKAVLKAVPVAERIPELQKGQVDLLAASLTRTAEREALIDFSLPNFTTGQKLMVRKDSGIKRLGELAGKGILTVKGSTMEKNVKATFPTSEVVLFENGALAFAALKQGKGVGYANDETTLIENLSQLPPSEKDYVVLSQRLSTEYLALGVKKGEAGLLNEVNKVMLAMEASGEAEAVFNKWFGPSTKMKFEGRPFKIESRERILAQ